MPCVTSHRRQRNVYLIRFLLIASVRVRIKYNEHLHSSFYLGRDLSLYILRQIVNNVLGSDYFERLRYV